MKKVNILKLLTVISAIPAPMVCVLVGVTSCSCSNKPETALHTIIFVPSDGITLTGKTTIKVNDKTKWKDIIKPVAAVPQGYTVKGWYSNMEPLEDNKEITSDLTAKYVAFNPQTTLNSVTVKTAKQEYSDNTFVQGGSWGQFKEVYDFENPNPVEGYDFDGWYMDQAKLTNDSIFTVGQLSFSVEARYTKSKHTITLSATEGGKVDKTSIEAETGTTWGVAKKQITVTADQGFQFKEWTKDGTILSDDYIIDSNFTAKAIFEKVRTVCTITLSATEGGKVDKTSIEAETGTTWGVAKKQITVTADQGFHFKEWTKDGATLSDDYIIDSNFTAAAIFEKDVPKKIKRIDITTQPDLLIYEKGEYFDPIGMVVNAIYDDETTRVLDRNEWETNIEYNSILKDAGSKNVTVSLVADGSITTNFKIEVVSSADVVLKGGVVAFGDIAVKFNLKTNHEFYITGYKNGSGTMVVPDCYSWNGKKYYIKQIPSDWSDGENDIKGLIFDSSVKHLKVIQENAFHNTNALDYYINNHNQIMKFPEGLVKIASMAFFGCDYSITNKMLGYDFPSTIKEIGDHAFGTCPWIDAGDSQIIFRCPKNQVNCDDGAFTNNSGRHKTKYIYGLNDKDAYEWAHYLCRVHDFHTDGFKKLLVPKVLPRKIITLSATEGGIVDKTLFDVELHTKWGEAKKQVTVTANPGYLFKEWRTKDGKTLSDDWTINYDLDAVAVFEKIHNVC